MSQQQGNDMRLEDSSQDEGTVTSSKAIEDKLNKLVQGYTEWLPKGLGLVLKAELQAIITTETTKAAAEATGLTEADRYDKLTDTQRKWLVRYHKMCLAALQEEQVKL